MKLFINDWDGNMDTFIADIEENKEYPIDTMITTGENKEVYLVSAYVYDKFVMFFYMYDSSCNPEHNDRIFKIPETYRESIEISRKHKRLFDLAFEYEVNHLKPVSGRGSEYSPEKPPLINPDDEFAKMYNSEYDYLYNLMKEADRIPEALIGKTLTFKKDCHSFESPVNEISHLALYPQRYKTDEHYVGSVFKAPYGKCDVKVPYTTSDTGETSFFIIKELKFYNMLEIFEEHYEEYKKAHEAALQNYEKTKDSYGENCNIMSLEDMRQVFDRVILRLSVLKPEERRSFILYTNDFLDSKIRERTGNSFSSGVFLFGHDEDDKMDGELYKYMLSLGEVSGEPNDEYEITLMSVTDSFEIERKALFEQSY